MPGTCAELASTLPPFLLAPSCTRPFSLLLTGEQVVPAALHV